MMLALILAWAPPAPSCNAFGIEVWDSYINGPGIGNHTDGLRTLALTQTSLDLAPGKPVEACSIAWRLTSVDINGQPLGPECQPTDVTADGQAWRGI